MNNITVIKKNSKESSVEFGQIYENCGIFYIVAKIDGAGRNCLINLNNGNLWSYEETAEEIIRQEPDFILFEGTLQITTQ